MTTIFWAGDSTVQYNDILTFPQTGIGQVMNPVSYTHLALGNECVMPH